MGDVISIADRIARWREIFSYEDEHTSVKLFVNDLNGEMELLQINNEEEAIRTVFSTVDAATFMNAVSKAHDVLLKKGGKPKES